jgi:hypothetical protein
MAVSRAGIGYTQIAPVGTSGTRDIELNVAAADNTYGIVVFGFVGDTDVSTSGVFGATWPGETLVPLLDDPLYFDEHTGHYHSMLMGWIVEAPAAGATTVELSWSGVESGLLAGRAVFGAAGVFSSVEPLDLDAIADAVVSAVGSTSVSTSGVTVPSAVPADRVISAHLIGKYRGFSSFSGSRLAAPILPAAGQLLLGESRGAVSTVATATHSASTANWASFGLNLDALPIENLGFASSITVPPGSFGAGLYRFATPHPDRDYLVPPVGDSDPNLLAGVTLRNANGVDMPVWVKDPDSVLDYTLRWNNHLAPDDELVRVEHVPFGSLQILSEAINPEDKAMTQFWTKSGTPGINHEVLVRLWTKKGRQDDFTVFIQCENN